MLEPILSQIQHKLLESILGNMQSLWSGRSQQSGGSSLKARASEFDTLIADTAQKYGLDPSLLKAVAQAESNFSPTAVSSAGAKGLMQLMDATAQSLGVTDAFDPAQNIEGGAKFLSQLLNRYQGNETLALAAYNAGPGAVDKWGGVPPYEETQTYVPRILDLRNQYTGWLG